MRFTDKDVVFLYNDGCDDDVGEMCQVVECCVFV